MKGKRIAIDATTLEANAAMRSIVRRDTGESYEEFLRCLLYTSLTMRMAIRRFTRLTNAFSKKLLNLKMVVVLHFAYYNFCRVHSSLRVTPAMEAGLTDHVWTIAELLSAA